MTNDCTSCQFCGYSCYNFSFNLISSYYDYWLSKVEIISDNSLQTEKNNLVDLFDNFNYHRMLTGMSVILLNYGNGLTLTTPISINRDKNKQPISASVSVNLYTNLINSAPLNNDLGNGATLRVLNWKLFKKENSFQLREALNQMGLDENQAEIIDEPLSKYLLVKSTTPIYKAIFWPNNLSETPSLLHLNKIIRNVHELDCANDRNQELINSIYVAKTSKKLTREQANNLSVTVTTDRFGLIVTEADGTETQLGEGLQKEVLTQSLSNWVNIKSELETWEDKFQVYGGMHSEKLSVSRENVAESLMRTARVNSIEKRYYKYVIKFINEYNDYYDTKLVYQFDTLISDTIQTSANQIKIDNTPNYNKLTENNTQGEQTNGDDQ